MVDRWHTIYIYIYNQDSIISTNHGHKNFRSSMAIDTASESSLTIK